jgi:hypothetical protein
VCLSPVWQIKFYLNRIETKDYKISIDRQQWGSCYTIFNFMCMFYRSLFVLLYLFFWSLCCLFFFDIQILITPLVSSNSSYWVGSESCYVTVEHVYLWAALQWVSITDIKIHYIVQTTYTRIWYPVFPWSIIHRQGTMNKHIRVVQTIYYDTPT